MITQTYQEVSKEIESELTKLNVIPKNIHQYFYLLKKAEPQRFERLFFDTNGHSPYSEDLDSILMDFRISNKIKF